MENNYKILYLDQSSDENDLLLQQLKMRFACKGYQVETIHDENDFFYKIRFHRYHFLILDVGDQTRRAINFLERLQTLNKHLPTILVSAWQDFQLSIRAMQLGCQDIVIKNPVPHVFFKDLCVKLFQIHDHRQHPPHLSKRKKPIPSSTETEGRWEWLPTEDRVYWNWPGEKETHRARYASFIQHIHSADRALVKTQNNVCLFSHEPVDYSFRYLDKTGRPVFYHLHIKPELNERGMICRILGKIKKQSPNTVQQINQVKLSYFDHTPDAVVICDAENRIISVNPGFTQLTGFSPAAVLYQPASLLMTEKSDFDWQTPEQSLQKRYFWQGQTELHGQNSSIPVWQSTAVLRDKSGHISQMISVIRDIRSQQALLANIKLQANYDPLTQIPNRILLADRLKSALKLAHRNQSCLALMLLDLNKFKWFNDHLGHAAGDFILKETTRKLKLATRESDTIARLGGDEFVILAPELEKASDAERIAQKIFAEFSKPVLFENQQIFISGSIGIAVYPDNGDSLDELLKNADKAMYQAKKQTHSPNNFYFFTPALQQETLHRQTIINRIHKALRNNEFRLEYQPVVDIHSHKVVFAEALLRWQDPQHGNIPLEQFLSIAEESGIIKEIGTWVITTITEHVQRWSQINLPRLSISLNQSVHQYNTSNCHQEWINILHDKQVPADRIIFEVNESLFLEENKRYHANILALQEEGIKIALDKFGTGYSSLTCLKKRPADYIKIDRSFIHKITNDNADAAMINGISIMANSLKIRVIATGVEKEQQLKLLSANCDYAQGYYFSKPLSLEQFESYIFASNV